jgi:hypothetical protein
MQGKEILRGTASEYFRTAYLAGSFTRDTVAAQLEVLLGASRQLDAVLLTLTAGAWPRLPLSIPANSPFSVINDNCSLIKGATKVLGLNAPAIAFSKTLQEKDFRSLGALQVDPEPKSRRPGPARARRPSLFLDRRDLAREAAAGCRRLRLGFACGELEDQHVWDF